MLSLTWTTVGVLVKKIKTNEITVALNRFVLQFLPLFQAFGQEFRAFPPPDYMSFYPLVVHG